MPTKTKKTVKKPVTKRKTTKKVATKRSQFSFRKQKQAQIAVALIVILLVAIVGGALQLFGAKAATEGYSQSAEDNQVWHINAHRASHGWAAAKRSGCLTDIARAWSKAMAEAYSSGRGKLAHSNDQESGYYSYYTDYTVQIPNRCSQTNYALAAENVGVTGLYSMSKEDIVKGSETMYQAFINSPGHHKNIDGRHSVNGTNYVTDYVGVGSYVKDNRLLITHLFIDCVGSCAVWDVPPSQVGDPEQPAPPAPPPPSGAGTNTLTAGTTLKANERITSKNGNYYLIMQGDGNLVLYQKSPFTYLWNSTTHTNVGNHAIFQTDGNLVVYKNGGGACHSITANLGGKYLVMQDDGNLVIYKTDLKTAVWSSKTSYWYC